MFDGFCRAGHYQTHIVISVSLLSTARSGNKIENSGESAMLPRLIAQGENCVDMARCHGLVIIAISTP